MGISLSNIGSRYDCGFFIETDGVEEVGHCVQFGRVLLSGIFSL